jgi:hypothetical protein
VKLDVKRIGRLAAATVIFYFAAFTSVCWFLDLTFPGKLATQTRASVASDAGFETGVLAMVCSIIFWCSRRWFGWLCLITWLLWLVWISLPRL